MYRLKIPWFDKEDFQLEQLWLFTLFENCCCLLRLSHLYIELYHLHLCWKLIDRVWNGHEKASM